MKLGEGHLAVRFGDRGEHISVRLDGVAVTNQALEAVAGDPGWVLLYTEEAARVKHFCRRCPPRVAEPCMHIATGRVDVAVRKAS